MRGFSILSRHAKYSAKAWLNGFVSPEVTVPAMLRVTRVLNPATCRMG